jgi:N-acetylglucosamine malate deacetylase 2
MRTFLCLIFLAVFFSSCQKPLDYSLIAQMQDPTVPALDIEVRDTTRVLLVFAHADDEVVCGGLIAHFKAKGAKIHLLTLTEPYADVDNRNREWACAANQFGLESTQVAGLVNNIWEDIMQDKITFWYDQRDSVKAIVRAKIKEVNPHYLVTFDTEIGGYGHPEHRISAQVTEEVFYELQSETTFAGISQFKMTLPKKLADFMVGHMESYDLAKKLTGEKGLPSPEVALDMGPYWPVKNAAGHCYSSQIHILTRFHVVAPDNRKEEHFMAFNREYYTLASRKE